MTVSTLEFDNATLRRAQILYAAVTVIAAKGGDRARLKDVADESGVSLGLVQHYFRTRQELMAQAFEIMMAISLGSWDQVRKFEDDPLVALLAGIRLHVYGTVSFADRWGFWAEFWALARRESTLTGLGRKVYETWLSPFEAAFEELLNSGKLHPLLDPREAAVILTGAFDGIAIRSLMTPGAVSDEDIHAHLMTLVQMTVQVDKGELDAALQAVSRMFEARPIVEHLSPNLIARTMMRTSA